MADGRFLPGEGALVDAARAGIEMRKGYEETLDIIKTREQKKVAQQKIAEVMQAQRGQADRIRVLTSEVGSMREKIQAGQDVNMDDFNLAATRLLNARVEQANSMAQAAQGLFETGLPDAMEFGKHLFDAGNAAIVHLDEMIGRSQQGMRADRELGQGDRKLDQGDTALEQGQEQIDQEGEKIDLMRNEDRRQEQLQPGKLRQQKADTAATYAGADLNREQARGVAVESAGKRFQLDADIRNQGLERFGKLATSVKTMLETGMSPEDVQNMLDKNGIDIKLPDLQQFGELMDEKLEARRQENETLLKDEDLPEDMRKKLLEDQKRIKKKDLDQIIERRRREDQNWVEWTAEEFEDLAMFMNTNFMTKEERKALFDEITRSTTSATQRRDKNSKSK